jgi:hypothetical protein
MKTTSLPTRPSGSARIFAVFVIAVALLLASVAIPYAMMRDAYAYSVDRQRAREIASVCDAAQLAGYNPVDASGVETTVRNVVRGARVADRVFFVPGITGTDISRLSKHLQVSRGKLLYTVPVPARVVQ